MLALAWGDERAQPLISPGTHSEWSVPGCSIAFLISRPVCGIGRTTAFHQWGWMCSYLGLLVNVARVLQASSHLKPRRQCSGWGLMACTTSGYGSLSPDAAHPSATSPAASPYGLTGSGVTGGCSREQGVAVAIDSAVPRREEAHAPISGGYPGAAPGGAPSPLCSAHAPTTALRSLRLVVHWHPNLSSLQYLSACPWCKLSCSHVVCFASRVNGAGRCLHAAC